MAVIGLDLGGTKLAGAVFNIEGKILTEKSCLLEGRKGRDVGKLIMWLTLELFASAKEQKQEITALGISVPGISHIKKGTVWAPNIDGWEDYPLRRDLSSITKKHNIKLTIDSDRACSILGEAWKGAAKDCQNAIFLAVGTGIGAGILADGKVLRGASDIAGAIGWLALDRLYLPEYETYGCFEYHASGDGLARVTKKYLKNEKSYTGSLRKKDISEITAHDVFAAYDAGDPLAKKIVNEAIIYWGMAIANLVSLFNPEKIILGGGVFGPGLKFTDKIRTEAIKWAQPVSFREVKLVRPVLGEHAALFGAGYLALKIPS